MKVYQTFRYELKPNKSQEILLEKHAGCARFAYNWGLALIKERKEKPKAIRLHKLLNSKKSKEFPWMYEVSKCAPQEAIRDLEKAFKNFFAGRTNYPVFKKKGKDDCFRLTGTIKITGPKRIQLPRIGVIRTKENTSKFKGRILSATVKREADRWFVSLHVETERKIPELGQKGVCGVDCNTHAIVTTEKVYPLPKPLQRCLIRVKRRHKQLSRKKKGSKNRQKAIMKLARLYRRIKNIRLDFCHKLSTMLAKTKQEIVVEDLRVKNMVKNNSLARSIMDSAWRTLLRMLEYKTVWYGSELKKADRFFPSTKMCSNCGSLNEIPLGQKLYVCLNCGLTIDRDLNAAKNLAYLPQVLREVTPVEIGSTAEREKSRSTSTLSMKQELNYGIKFHSL